MADDDATKTDPPADPPRQDPPPADPPRQDSPADPPADDTPNGDTDGDDKAGKDDTDWKAHARRHEDGKKAEAKARAAAEKARDEATETLAAVRKAFGLDQADEDPKTVAEKATAAAAEKDAELRSMRLDRAAEKAGRRAGADVDRLGDSKAFSTALAKIDPESDTADDDVKALVEKTLKDHPHLKAATAPAGPASADMSGGAGEAGTGSGGSSIDQIREQRRKRRGTSS